MSFIRKLQNKLPLGFLRFWINLWPPLLGAGIKITNISPDYRTVDVALKLHWYNKNYVGTHFGGSIFAMTDPFYMLMLIKNLGSDYIVWDKAARIDYIKPGRTTLVAHFHLTDEIINTVKEKTANDDKYIFDLPIDVFDINNVLIASVVRTLYVRKKWEESSK